MCSSREKELPKARLLLKDASRLKISNEYSFCYTIQTWNIYRFLLPHGRNWKIGKVKIEGAETEREKEDGWEWNDIILLFYIHGVYTATDWSPILAPAMLYMSYPMVYLFLKVPGNVIRNSQLVKGRFSGVAFVMCQIPSRKPRFPT